jgi:hypothetical protein
MTQTENRPDDTAKDEERRGGFFLFLRRANSARGWGEWLISLFQSKAAIVAGGAVVAGGAGVAVFAPHLIFPPKAPIARSAEPERLADNTTIFTIEGSDKAGRKVTYEVVILSDAFTWVRGSAADLTRNGAAIARDAVLDQIFTPPVRARLKASGDLIAVGAASSEGQTQVEEVRAAQRAVTAAGWVRGLAPDKTVWTLNLGQFRASCASGDAARDTSWQRPLIIVGVRARQTDARLDEALADAMDQTKPLPSPTCYSAFKMEKAG